MSDPRLRAPLAVARRRLPGAAAQRDARSHRLDDLDVPRAPAEVPGDRLADLLARRARVVPRSAYADITMPGVQYPHWTAPASTNACWIRWSSPFAESPSIVEHVAPVALRGEHDAGVHRLPVQEDRARAALAAPAADLRAREPERSRGATSTRVVVVRPHGDRVLPAVHRERDVHDVPRACAAREAAGLPLVRSLRRPALASARSTSASDRPMGIGFPTARIAFSVSLSPLPVMSTTIVSSSDHGALAHGLREARERRHAGRLAEHAGRAGELGDRGEDLVVGHRHHRARRSRGHPDGLPPVARMPHGDAVRARASRGTAPRRSRASNALLTGESPSACTPTSVGTFVGEPEPRELREPLVDAAHDAAVAHRDEDRVGRDGSPAARRSRRRRSSCPRRGTGSRRSSGCTTRTSRWPAAARSNASSYVPVDREHRRAVHEELRDLGLRRVLGTKM